VHDCECVRFKCIRIRIPLVRKVSRFCGGFCFVGVLLFKVLWGGFVLWAFCCYSYTNTSGEEGIKVL